MLPLRILIKPLKQGSDFMVTPSHNIVTKDYSLKNPPSGYVSPDEGFIQPISMLIN